jgi:hypothetical protein
MTVAQPVGTSPRGSKPLEERLKLVYGAVTVARTEVLMSGGNGSRGSGSAAGGVGGAIWFIGWLFTWSFAHLVWWKIIVGIVIWPYWLGAAVGQ